MATNDVLDQSLAAFADQAEALADTQSTPSFASTLPASEPDNPLDAALNSYAGQDDTERLRSSVQLGIKGQPETALRVLQSTGRSGLPREFVERNLEYVEQEAAKQDFNPQRLMRDSPAYSSWLAEHPDHVAASKPDVAAMSFIEKQLRHIPAMFEQGQQTVEYSDLMLEIVQGLLDKRDVTDLRTRQKDLEARMSRPDETGLLEEPGVGGVAQRAPGWMAQQLPILARTLSEQVKAGATGVAVGGTLGGAAGGLPGAAVGGTVTGLAAWRVGAAMSSAKMEFAQAFGEYEKLKDADGNALDQQTALGLAGMVGVVNGSIDGFFGLEGLTSKLPGINQFSRQGIKELLKTPTTSRALLGYARTVGQVMMTEGVTEALQMYITKAGGVALQAVQNGGSPSEWFGQIFTAENLKQAATEAEAGAFGGGGIAAVMTAPQTVQDLRRVKEANQTRQAFEAIGDAVAKTKFASDLPGPLREIIERATKDGPIEQVYVPAEAFNEYFQKESVDPRAVYQEITGDVEAYDRAVETGGDLPIKTADYAAKLAGTKHNSFFAQNLRTSLDAMTAVEAEAWIKEQDAAEQAAAEQAGVESATADDPAAAVRMDIAGQLSGLGFAPDVVDQYAALFESRYRARAERRGLGETAADLFRSLNLGVTRPVPAVLQQMGTTTELDGLLDRLRTGDLPNQTEVFGQSLMEFLRASGGVQDEGGELAARNVDANTKPFTKKFAQKKGLTLDEAAQRAVEAGYLEARDLNALLDAIDQESRGTPVYAVGREQTGAFDALNNLESLRLYLENKGVDVKTSTNAQIKQLLGEAVQQSLPGEEGLTFAQEMLPAPPVVPPFFSKLEAVVGEKMGGKMPGTDLRKMLLANGVKEEELKWTGFDDFLKGKTVVTKAEATEFLANNLVVIQPVMLGGVTKITEEEAYEKYAVQIEQLTQMGWSTTFLDEGNGVDRVGFVDIHDEDDMSGEILSWDELPNEQPGTTKPANKLTDAQIKAALGTEEIILLNRSGLSNSPATMERLGMQADQFEGTDTSKIYGYTLPDGGTSYFFKQYNGTYFIPIAGEELQADTVAEARRILYEEFVAPEMLDVRPNAFGTSDSPRDIAHYLERQIIDPAPPSGSSAPKFASWQMKPGEGVNYREVLLTLPAPKRKMTQAEREEMSNLGLRGKLTKEQKARYDELNRIEMGPNEDQFNAGHYQVPNVLAHVRINDRTDSEGRRVMFVEEIQSDWHQKARDVRKAEVRRQAELAGVKKGDLAFKDIEAGVPADFGYRKKWKPEDVAKFRVLEPPTAATGGNEFGSLTNLGGGTIQGDYVVLDGDGNVLATPPRSHNKSAKEALDLIKKSALSGTLHGMGKFPAAPFMKTEQWAGLALKWLLRHAAEGNYDVMAWTPGAVQNKRYSLSQQIEQVRYEKNQDGTYHLWVKPIGSSEVDQIRNTDFSAVPVGGLSDIVGKEVAEKIVEGFSSAAEDQAGQVGPLHLEDMERVTGAKLIRGREEMVARGFLDEMSLAGIQWADGSVSGYDNEVEAGEALRDEYNKKTGTRPAISTLPKHRAQSNVITGIDLDIAGGGMKSFYDKLVPNVLKDIGKKWGAKVEAVALGEKRDALAMVNNPAPTFRAISKVEWDGYGGAESWDNGSKPRIADTQVRINGKNFDVQVIISKSGVSVSGASEASEPFEYFSGEDFTQTPGRDWSSATPAEQRVLDLWDDPVSSLWHHMTLIHGDPFDGDMEAPTNAADQIGPVPSKAEAVDVQGMPVTDEMKKSVLYKGFPLFQGADKPKGSITFGNQKVNIKLFEKADLSTFIHESGHLYLNEMVEDAKAIGAVPVESRTPAQTQLLADLQTLYDWMGVKDGAIKTEQHEQFARGFEAYAMEGKSPSSAMRQVFVAFRSWLIQAYRSLTTAPLNVKLTQNVREVMDRMLATDAEILAAETEAEILPLFTDAESAGMTPTRFAAYQKSVAEASTVARERLQKQLMAQYQRQHEDWWKKAREEKVAAITLQVNDQNEYVALAVLQTGKFPNGDPLAEGIEPMKLDRKAIEKQFGKAFVKRMPKGTTGKGGMHPDTAAPMFGYNTGQDLVMALVNARPRRQLIEAEADRQMQAEYGDMRIDGTIADAARAAVLNEHQEDVVAAEMRALNAKAREVAPFVKAERADADAKQKEGRQLLRTMIPTLKDTRELARKIIARTALKVLEPSAHAINARQASRLATQALAKDDYVNAGIFKQRELLNLALFRESTIVQEQVEKSRESFKDFFQSDAKLAKSRNVDLVNIGRAILAQHGLGKPTEKTAAEYLEPIKTYDQDLYNQWRQVVDALAPRPLDYRALTVEEFTRLSGDLEALWTLSRRVKQIKINDQLVDREQIVDELTAGMVAFTKPQTSQIVGAQTKWKDTVVGLLSWRSALRRVESWADAMDGGPTGGIFRRYLWTPISDASILFRSQKKTVLLKYLDLMKTIEATISRDLIPAPELGPGAAFRGRAALIHALLHTGNESNFSKLLRGYKWEPANWQRFVERAIRDRLITKADYDYAQGVWDLLESLKPEAQKAHHEMYGYYFSEITAKEVVTPWKTYRGGYVPAIADRNMSVDQAIREEKDLFDQGGNSFMFPTTGRGFTKSRVEEYAAPLALDLTGIPVHLDKTLRFIYLEPRIKDAARLVTNKALRTGLDAMDPTVAKDMLVPWLQRSAQQTVSTPGKNRHADRLFRYLRKSVSAQIMVGNVINTLQQFTGFSSTLLKVKARYMRGAMVNYLRHPIDYAENVSNRSAFMKGRTSTQVIEIQDTIDDILLNPTKYEQARKFADRHGYFLQQGAQNLVDLIAWGGAYDQAIANGEDDVAAVQAADAVVRETQGSFAPEDISAFEAGTPFVRAFTMFYSYFNMQANLLGTEFHKVAHDMGLKKGAGRAFYIYFVGFLIPAVMAEAIVKGIGGFDPDDDDDYLNEALSLFFGSQIRTALALFPGVGPVTLAGINMFNDKWYDDRISTSPVVSLLESAVRAPHSLYKAMAEEGKTKRAVRDLLTLVGLVTGLPAGSLARPLSYLADVSDGVAQPENPGDVARGLLSGRDVNRTK